MNEQTGGEENAIAVAHAATLNELEQLIDTHAGLYEIVEPSRQHQLTIQVIEGGLDLNAGLNDIIPGLASRPPSRRWSGNSPSINDADERVQQGGSKTHALTLVNMALRGMDILRGNQENGKGPSRSNGAESAFEQLLDLKAGIDDSSITLDGAQRIVRQAIQVLHNFYADQLQADIALIVSRTLGELRRLEAILPKLFKQQGSEARTAR